MTTGDKRMLPGGDLSLNKIAEGYPEDPRTDEDMVKGWIDGEKLTEDEDFSEEVTMVGNNKHWTNPLNDQPQKGPSSVAKINAEVKNVTRELNEVDADLLHRATRKYLKINKVTQQVASDFLSKNPSLINEWANK